jgi:hypothetical protein
MSLTKKIAIVYMGLGVAFMIMGVLTNQAMVFSAGVYCSLKGDILDMKG